MKNYTQLKLNSAFVFACFSLIMLSSCGSYQYVGSTSDGIYSEDEPEYVVIEDVSYQEEPNSNYYSNYFREKALEVESTEDVDPVFTDVDSYESQSNINSNQNAGWGDNSSQVNINVYDSGWNNWGWGYPYNGWNNWGWNRPFGWNYGYGWNNWGWNNWGWNSWGWNNWGWNSGFYGGYYGGLHPFYGYGYGFYGNPYYGYNGFRNNYAYSTSRRGSSNGYLNRNYAPNSRSSSLLNRRGSTTSNGTRVNSQPRGRTESSTRPRVNNSSNQPRTSSPRYNTPRKNTSRTSTPRTSTPRTSTPRSSTPRATTPRSSTPRSYSTPRSNSSYSSPRSSSSSSSRRPR